MMRADDPGTVRKKYRCPVGKLQFILVHSQQGFI